MSRQQAATNKEAAKETVRSHQPGQVMEKSSEVENAFFGADSLPVTLCRLEYVLNPLFRSIDPEDPSTGLVVRFVAADEKLAGGDCIDKSSAC